MLHGMWPNKNAPFAMGMRPMAINTCKLQYKLEGTQIWIHIYMCSGPLHVTLCKRPHAYKGVAESKKEVRLHCTQFMHTPSSSQ